GAFAHRAAGGSPARAPPRARRSQPRGLNMGDALAEAIGKELGGELSDALARIGHCLDQLTDEQVWSRPAEGVHGVGNLLLHLTGNVRQWLVAGLGGAPDHRDRPAEFAVRASLPKADLWAGLRAAVAEARAALAAVPAESWLRTRRIQGFDV